MAGAMADANAEASSRSPAKFRKRRIPTSCGACRQSKVKCDGRRPCSRCRSLQKVCKFEERPKVAHQLEIDELKREVENLRLQLAQQKRGSVGDDNTAAASAVLPTSVAVDSSTPFIPGNPGLFDVCEQACVESPASSRATGSHTSGNRSSSYSQRRPLSYRADRATGPFHINLVGTQDVVDAGLITLDQATSYFATFFRGCDRYVPVFDADHDALDSVRSRSGILFSVICTAGCRAFGGTDCQPWRVLNLHTRRMVNAAVTVPAMLRLETIQALLVRACYSSERSLLVAAAARMAVDLGLPDAYDELVSRVFAMSRSSEDDVSVTQDEDPLMRKTRTWLHILNMGYILHIDAGDMLTVKLAGDARRGRVLLRDRLVRKQDMCLWPQVELNVLRAQMLERLSQRSHTEAEIMDIVSDAIIDINIWFDDWKRICDPRNPHTPWLMLNMQVQRCWGVTMALCRAIRITGVENVDVMSPTQKQMLGMTRAALAEHLDIVTSEPRLYLRNLRFAMDFVWAKCVFCYLLLLKLSILLLPPERGRRGGDDDKSLLQRGNVLLSELSEADGGPLDGHRSSTARMYLQLLETGMQRYQSAVEKRGDGDGGGGQDVFAPEQFLLEWDFPGLTLYSSSIMEAGWLDDVMMEAFGSIDDLMAFGWASAEPPSQS
ncbi:uncharacterized protein UV8b_07059 [Ustilaginoidea virens]|uniref:Zn(2)-C6 fungal-type domain-containing protein n=1 Tax=Ustilaginoidea virens TaxID=1159556 RepID=A0A8E5MJP1_USTVR|nr:uncharacterized protein UV8b_07059 [Ustilaginoidea virens]QUC22818.1 hypothetical protein UV8b_07059 [Ustilaginoidea virens]